MTPAEILEQAKRRIEILLIKEEDRLEGFIRDALEFYSYHAGILIRRVVEQPEMSLFPPPLSFNGTYNSRGDWCMSRYEQVTGTLHIHDKPIHSPWNVSYFVNMRQWDLNTPLPSDIEFSLLIDYTECLVGEANAQKLALSKWVAQLDNMETRGAADYQQQRVALEETIRRQALLPDFAIL